jgi:hypothetical protein
MKPRHLWALALALTCWMAGPAHAASWEDFAKPYITGLATKSENGNVPRGLNPSPHFITINPVDWYDTEQAAVSGFSWGKAPDRLVVGGAFRGYSEASPWAFGIATEALSAPTSNAHLIGAEHLVVSRNPQLDRQREVGPEHHIHEPGHRSRRRARVAHREKRFNERSRAIVIESMARTSAGEFSGWQTGLYFGATAFDRTISKPYAAVLDVSDVGKDDSTAQAQVPVYVLVFRCGQSRCGFKASSLGLEMWETIDTTPRLVRIL